MKKVLVPLAEGFEEIEAVTVIDILRRAGAEVVTAGLLTREVTGSRKIRLTADCLLDEVNEQTFDLVVLPGGQPGVDHLRADSRILRLVKERHERRELLGAICAAPLILRDAGIIAGKTLTSYPSVKDELPGCSYEEQRVVCDGWIVTSRAPGTALEFSLQLAGILMGKDKAGEIARQVLAP